MREDLPALSNYLDFLALIDDDDVYEVHTVREYDSAYDPDRVNILLRHDVDYADGLDMARLDRHLGFRSTNYLRVYSDSIPSAPPEYRIADVAESWNWLAKKGGMEVGYHYDVMDETTVGFTKATDVDAARTIFADTLGYLRGFFDVQTVSAHGGTYNYLYESGEFERQLNLEPFGVVSAAHLPFTRFPPSKYYFLSDVDGRIDYLREKVQERDMGDVVQVLIHPFSKRWTVEDLAPSPAEQVTPVVVPTSESSPAQLPSPASSSYLGSTPSSPAMGNPSLSSGIDPRLGLLAAVPSAMVAVAMWRQKRMRAKGR